LQKRLQGAQAPHPGHVLPLPPQRRLAFDDVVCAVHMVDVLLKPGVLRASSAPLGDSSALLAASSSASLRAWGPPETPGGCTEAASRRSPASRSAPLAQSRSMRLRHTFMTGQQTRWHSAHSLAPECPANLHVLRHAKLNVLSGDALLVLLVLGPLLQPLLFNSATRRSARCSRDIGKQSAPAPLASTLSSSESKTSAAPSSISVTLASRPTLSG